MNKLIKIYRNSLLKSNFRHFTDMKVDENSSDSDFKPKTKKEEIPLE